MVDKLNKLMSQQVFFVSGFMPTSQVAAGIVNALNHYSNGNNRSKINNDAVLLND